MAALAKDIYKLFKEMNSKTITYNKSYYRLTKSTEGAILLSHLTYLYSDVFNSDEFYQTDSQLRETLGWSERTLKTAKSKIKPFVTVTKKGMPAKNHWQINIDKIISELLLLKEEITQESAAGPVVASSDKKESTAKKAVPVLTGQDENVLTGQDENVRTGRDENVLTNNKELNKQHLTNNNKGSSVVVFTEEIINEAAKVGVNFDRETVGKLLDRYPAYSVMEKIELLKQTPGIKNPTAWLRDAIRKNYMAPHKAEERPRAEVELWTPELQAHRNSLVQGEKEANWREKELAKYLAKVNPKSP